MSSFPQTEPRRVCHRCRRPESVCYCQYVTQIQTETRIVLLQHPRERDVAIGTARMASLCLANSELLVGFDWENSRELAELLSEPGRHVALLYPGEQARTLETVRDLRPLTLVVVDGTWSNTRKMVRKNPILAQLPRIAFAPPRPSEYRIRREPAAECVSTIEALSHVLSELEGEKVGFERMLLPFRKMVDKQLECKSLRGTPRSRYRPKPEPRLRTVPSAFLDNADKLVCVCGEANAWPCRDLVSRGKYPDELVQWVARRVATGETFACFARPRHPLAPNTPKHVAVDADTLMSGEQLDVLLRRWREFVRGDDAICSWGRYSTALFAQSGGYLPELRFDLRLVVKDLLKRNIGTLEEYHATIEPDRSASTVGGRAHQRLGQLVSIAKHLSSP